MLHCRAVGFDQRPFLRFLICKHSPLLEQDLHSIVDAYLGGRDFYVPSPLLPQSVLEATRVACRFPVSPLHLNTDHKATVSPYCERMCCQRSAWRVQMLSVAVINSLTFRLGPLSVHNTPCVMRSQRAAAASTVLCWACATSARSAASPPSMPHLRISAPSAHSKRPRAMCSLWRRRPAAVCSWRTPCRRAHSSAAAQGVPQSH